MIQKIVKEIRIADGWKIKERKEVQIVLQTPPRAISRGTIEYVPTYEEIRILIEKLIVIYNKEKIEKELGIKIGESE